MLKNPVPILKQQKSEIIKNPLIQGAVNESKSYKTNRNNFLLDENIEFTETIDEIFYELYHNGKINITRKKIKWLLIIILFILIIMSYYFETFKISY